MIAFVLDPALRRLRQLSFGARLLALAKAGFVLFLLVAMLVRGIDQGQRGFTGPMLDWYGSGLVMAHTWGMFAKPHRSRVVVVRGETREGATVDLSPLEGGLRRRYLDQRMRKFRSALARDDLAALRKRSGEYFCAWGAKRLPPLSSVTIVEVTSAGQGAEKKLLEVRCP